MTMADLLEKMYERVVAHWATTVAGIAWCLMNLAPVFAKKMSGLPMEQQDYVLILSAMAGLMTGAYIKTPMPPAVPLLLMALALGAGMTGCATERKTNRVDSVDANGQPVVFTSKSMVLYTLGSGADKTKDSQTSSWTNPKTGEKYTSSLRGQDEGVKAGSADQFAFLAQMMTSIVDSQAAKIATGNLTARPAPVEKTPSPTETLETTAIEAAIPRIVDLVVQAMGKK